VTETLKGSRILLGVSGGIAAYKACELTRGLRELGAEVQVLMTAAAQQFVTPMTFQALSGRPVRIDLWDPLAEAAMGHIELARFAEQIVIAPASADCLARLAHGLASDLLSTVCLASAAPLLIAPAMNQQMWRHPATQANLTQLLQRGVRCIGPETGAQACGDHGPGRMAEPSQIIADLLAQRAQAQVLAGRRLLISAGPTFEDIDPARFIGNRSSGRMGFAIAAAAAAMGAETTLIAGPVALATPTGVRRIDVRSAAEMHAAVLREVGGNEVFIAAAAVADYRPATPQSRKIKRTAQALELSLIPNPDIVAAVAALPNRPLVVGFAAETEDLLVHARSKLERKHLDLICANQIGVAGTGFECDDNQLTLLWPGGERALAPAPKTELARALLLEIAARLAQRGR
jgi:phosphopantothenoylcysteine decarboxylase/phosphopantothenate--cysteine ligase